MTISAAARNEILDHALSVGAWTMPTNLYVQFHDASPTDACTTGVIASTSRQGDTAMNAAASGATANTSAITHTSMPSCTVSHISLWDAASSGNPLWFGALSSAVSCGSGDTFEIAAGDLDVTLT